MENKKEKLEDFKTAISSTVRSISKSQKIEISFGNQISNSDNPTIKLPELSRISNKLNFEENKFIANKLAVDKLKLL